MLIVKMFLDIFLHYNALEYVSFSILIEYRACHNYALCAIYDTVNAITYTCCLRK